MAAPARAADVVGSSLKLDVVLPALQAIVPRLSLGRHKGDAGKIAVVGGCKEYTGAPFFAGISALKMGADLAHVFCSKGAATVIKSYSPELIVHPTLEESYLLSKLAEKEKEEIKQKVLEEVEKWLPRFDCLVIGPGLGRDPLILDCVAAIIDSAKRDNIPMVIDGDALFLVTNNPELVCGYPLAILTPNFNEYKRLVARIMGPENDVLSNYHDIPDNNIPSLLKVLANRMGGVTIVQKGEKDIISDGNSVLISGFFGSPRRCGGQGDVLSGSIGVFTPWARQFLSQQDQSVTKLVTERLSKNPTLSGAFAGSLLVRKAAATAFSQHKRSTVTTNIIDSLGIRSLSLSLYVCVCVCVCVI
ncbi:hypothetical protein O6H91_13G025900 [Diphasiastrum complanatum]|uniref:Uncharacterized protein n=1 Tax=Diphasiastrum complanatum TaxID=34168 RepID=A0ACC2BT54_DIPCM|nr:hypothetical protein O6H91_13G025900 [Diphasiastrum complanatum]